jgi:hypothetical protein
MSEALALNILAEIDAMAYSRLDYSLPPGVRDIAREHHTAVLGHMQRAVKTRSWRMGHMLQGWNSYEAKDPSTSPYNLALACLYSCERQVGFGCRKNCQQCQQNAELERAGREIRVKMGKIVEKEVPGCGVRTGLYFTNAASLLSLWNTRYQYGPKHWQALLDGKAMPLKRLQAMRDWTLEWQDQSLLSGFIRPGREGAEWKYNKNALNQNDLRAMGCPV